MSAPTNVGDAEATVSKGPVFSDHMATWKMDVSAHRCPKNFLRELQFIFPTEDISNVLAIPTMQCARTELVRVGDDVEAEKDRLLERFMSIAKVLCEEFMHAGHWADYIDPCSGLPMIHQTVNKVFDEVASAQQLLGYNVQNAGCCKVLLHPQWGSAVYPATLFTKAPPELVSEKLALLRDGLYDSRIEVEVERLIAAAAAAAAAAPAVSTT